MAAASFFVALVVLLSDPELLLLLELLPQAAATRLRLTASTKLHRSRGVMRVMVGESSRIEDGGRHRCASARIC